MSKLIGRGDNYFGDIIVNDQILFDDWEIEQNVTTNAFEINNSGVNAISITNGTQKVNLTNDLCVVGGTINLVDTNEVIESNGTDMYFSVGGSEVVRFENGGNVGIGTDNPVSLLHLEASIPTIRLEDGTNTFTMKQEADGEINFHNVSNTATNAYQFENNTGTTILALQNDGVVNVPVNDFSVNTDGLFVDVSEDKVGINISTPLQNLHVNQDDSLASYARFTNSTTTNGADIGVDADEDLIVWHNDNNHILFATNNLERMRIEDGGNVGIGINNPATLLHVSDDVNGNVETVIENLNAGTAAQTILTLCNDTGTGTQLRTLSSVFTTSGASIADSGILLTENTLSGGLSLVALQNHMRFYTGGSTLADTVERMRIEDGGNVGIGTDNPGQLLDIFGDVASAITCNIRNINAGDGSIAIMRLTSDASSFDIRQYSTGTSSSGVVEPDTTVIFCHDNNSNGLRITSNNDMRFFTGGTGTTNTTNHAHINTSGRFSMFATADASTSTLRISKSNNDTTTNVFQEFYRGGTDAETLGTLEGDIRLDGGGNLAFLDASDINLKKNIKNYNVDLSLFKNLDVKEYEWKDSDKTGKSIGFIAQDLQALLPKAVSKFYPKSIMVKKRKVGKDENGNDIDREIEVEEQDKSIEYLGITQKTLIPYMFGAIKQLLERIEELEKK
jgi:hypothetical protein